MRTLLLILLIAFTITHPSGHHPNKPLMNGPLEQLLRLVIRGKYHCGLGMDMR